MKGPRRQRELHARLVRLGNLDEAILDHFKGLLSSCLDLIRVTGELVSKCSVHIARHVLDLGQLLVVGLDVFERCALGENEDSDVVKVDTGRTVLSPRISKGL